MFYNCSSGRFNLLFLTLFNFQAGIKEKKQLLTFLSGCNIVKLIVRLITLKSSSGKEIFTKYLYYHCISILAYITDKRYVDNLERIRNMKIIRAYHAIPRLVEFLDPLNNDPLIIYQAAEALKHLAKDKADMCLKIYTAGGLQRCLHFMLRKEPYKMFADYLKEHFSSKYSMPSEEVKILEKFYCGKQILLKKFQRYPQVGLCDFKRECFTFMSAELQESCALIVFEVSSYIRDVICPLVFFYIGLFQKRSIPCPNCPKNILI